MLNTKSIEQFETHIDGLYAFRVNEKITREDLRAMADVMNDAFDVRDEVDMLISLKASDGADFDATFDTEIIKANFRALTKVRNYCVAYAPGNAEKIMNLLSRVLPVEAKTFGSEHNALQHLRAQAKKREEEKSSDKKAA